MTVPLDRARTQEIVQKLEAVGAGDAKKWKRIKRRIKDDRLSADDVSYIARIGRTYQKQRPRSRIMHVRLAQDDTGHDCSSCGTKSDYYCIANDAYFCQEHVIGHDENER